MPDRRLHRGPHGDDRRLFRSETLGDLNQSVNDLCWLLERGYAERSAVKLVGDRYRLVKRQRLAVARCACSDRAAADRQSKQIDAGEIPGRKLLIDGFNLLVTVEAALAGGIVLKTRDGCFRDLASVHGTYRKVAETVQAIELIGRCVGSLGGSVCRWYLDRPVSNSGRLKQQLMETATAHGWNWHAELVDNPDRVLGNSEGVVVSADSVVLDRCAAWFNLARFVVSAKIPAAWVVRL